MVNERNYFYVGGFFSLTIYFLTLFLVFSYMIRNSENIKHFSTQKENFLEISIVAEKKPEIITKPIEAPKPKPIEKVEPKKEEPKPEPVVQKETQVKQNIQDLFGTIKTKAVENVQKVRKPIAKKLEISHESSESKSVAKELVKELDYKKPQIAVSSSVGEYNEYYGKISEILNEKWHNTYSTTPGVSAWVDIVINPNGTFDYKISKPSYNNNFNAMLMDFLESMRSEVFPLPENGKIVKLNVEFKETF